MARTGCNVPPRALSLRHSSVSTGIAYAIRRAESPCLIIYFVVVCKNFLVHFDAACRACQHTEFAFVGLTYFLDHRLPSVPMCGFGCCDGGDFQGPPMEFLMMMSPKSLRNVSKAVVLMATPCPKSLHGKGEKWIARNI